MRKVYFTTPSYAYFLKNKEKGKYEYKFFKDGEHYLRILSDVKDSHCILIGGTIDDYNTMLLYDIASGLIDKGCQKLSIVIPYFGYSTMERKVKDGEVITAKNRARILSSLPRCPNGIKFYLFDLHAEGLPYYFENHQVEHVYTKDLLFDYIKNNFNLNDLVLASTDAGRSKWVQSLAKDLGVPPAFICKERNGEDTEVVSIGGNVKDKNVLIYDDMIRSGNSLIKASLAYKNNGAKKIYSLTTHGVFPESSIEKILSSGIENIATTNSHPNGLSEKVDIIDLIELIEKLFI